MEQRCFTCAVPITKHGLADRKINILLGRRAEFCKDHFRLAMKDVEEALTAHPTVRRLFEL